MGRYRAEIEQDFLTAFSDDLLRDVVRASVAAYRSAHEDCRVNYPVQVAHDLYPVMRRANLERDLLAIADGYSEITGTSKPNHKGTSYYTLLSSGHVFLTANAVKHPNELVRYAMYRETYAIASAPNLFGPPPEEGRILYAILLHGPEQKDKMRPEFVHIVFPNRDCSEYVGRIDLLARFADLVKELRKTEEESVPDKAFPSLRPGVERRKDEDEGAEGQTG